MSILGATKTASGQITNKLAFLDLRRSSISILERLVLEEALLRHDPQHRCWAIVGVHEPTLNRFISLDDTKSNQIQNHDCAVVLGIGGKPNELLNLDLIRKDGVLCIKRFSGGGTVVVDYSSLFTTFIGRSGANHSLSKISPYPRDIMQWTADVIFQEVFHQMNNDLKDDKISKKSCLRPTLVVDTKSCGLDQSGEVISIPTNKQKQTVEIPEFFLRENDYVFGNKKMGGNAQSIVKGGWLHHTSFLWDYEEDYMNYLTLPSKRPDYRKDRTHDEFLVKLKTYYEPLLPSGKHIFFDNVKKVASTTFEVEEITLTEAISIVDSELGGMQNWFDGKCRTKVLDITTL